MFKKTLCIIYTLSIVTFAKAQEFEVVNWNKIEFEVNSAASQFYYPNLFKRYLNADTTLSKQDYFYLYYGYPTQQNYKPLLDDPNIDSLGMVFSKKNTTVDFDKIIKYSKKILNKEPFNLRDINALAFALEQTGHKDEAAKQMRKIDLIVNTIKSTGNGLTQETPWFVIYSKNCEDLLAFMGYNVSRKMIVSREVMFLQVTNLPEKLKKYKGFYFNYAEIYKRKPDYLEGADKPKRKMEFNPKYNPKSKLNVLPK